MKMYRTTGPITINSGEIKLNERQAEARKHLLKPTETEGVFLAKGELCFKAGEVIGLPVVSKAMSLLLTSPDELLVDTGKDQKKAGKPKR